MTIESDVSRIALALDQVGKIKARILLAYTDKERVDAIYPIAQRR